jgi:hypothetical protein
VSQTQSLKLSIDDSVPEGNCAHCRRELPDDEERLDLGGTFPDSGTLVTVTICRSCLSEHMPDLLAVLDGEVDLCAGHDDEVVEGHELLE